MPKFTFVAKEAGLVQIGSVIKLAVSESDPSGVDGFIDGKLVGTITNDPNLIFGRGAVSAKRIRNSAINHPQCASAQSLVLNYEKHQHNGRVFHLYEAELFVVPKRENKTQKANEAIRYNVGGSAVQNPKKADLLGKLQALKNNGKPVNTSVMILRTGTEYRIVRLEQPVAGASAGIIKDPDEILSNLIPEGGTYPATVVELDKRDYVIEIAPETKDISQYYPLVDAAVARCAGQSKAVEEKVRTMLNARFDHDVIEAVLSQMPTLGHASKSVPNPATKYTQRNGCNLSDLTCYMLSGKMVRLVGEKGSGKNTLVETACWLLNRPLCRVQGSSELDKLDLLGSRTLVDGSTGFELSEFLQTLSNDGIVVVDEVNTVRPEVLTILHSLTDGARSIDVPGYGTVRMGPHACILYTMNEDYVGTGEMNAATIDRGPSMFIEQESNMEALLRQAVPDADDESISICCRVSDEIHKTIRSGSSSLSAEAITVRGYIDALQCIKFIPLRRALIQNVANKAQSATERATIEGIITATVV